ncbi:tyrosine-type recombinase/integrase [Streptomyces uncialis]|uniref:tyrosine-type recombinase/integrase n=1 Tax=Streptomyces uncialis TaxID=1048205 RepID=UPI00386C61EA|nr:site-specific integrase [Streptomyces uncialis]
MLTYDVEFWAIRERKGRPKPFELRWRVGTRAHSKSYKLSTQADGRRSELLGALRARQQFDVDTGLPVDELAALTEPTWYEHALAYVLMKWPRAAAKHRAGIAEALAVVSPVLVTTTRGAPDRKVLRNALYGWAFRAVATADGSVVSRFAHEDPPQEIAAALAWLAQNSMKLSTAGKPEHMRAALAALSLKLDGKAAADNTVNRKVMALSNCLRYAVEKGHYPRNPLLGIDWTPPKTHDEVDFRYVPGPSQARALINGVKEQGVRGEHLAAFFGCIYYAGMRPAEVSALKDTDYVLPPEEDPDAWGELLLEESRPEVGAGWTDDGTSYETRGLKRRARRATRPVPAPPVLVRMLREHRKQFGTAPDGRLFRAAEDGRVRSTEYCELWAAARKKALGARDAETPLAEVPYSLRHAGVSLWIKAGVDPVEVARRAGHSVAVLFRFYAKILRGGQEHANSLIGAQLDGE